MVESSVGRRRPLVTYAVIAACCLAFALGPTSGLDPAYGSGNRLVQAQAVYLDRWGVVPDALWNGQVAAPLTPLTALFVHAGWLHLIGNMVFLYVFGAMVEQRMGRLRFVLFYLAAGYLALIGYAMVYAGSDQTLIGASGAISGVLGAFLWLFPTARVTTCLPFLFFLPLRFPAWVVLAFWLALQGVAAHGADASSGVAYLAHLIGFGIGFLYAWARFGRTAKVSSAAGQSRAAGPNQGEREGQP